MESRALTGCFLCAFPNSEKPQPSDGRDRCLALHGGGRNSIASRAAGWQPFLQCLVWAAAWTLVQVLSDTDMALGWTAAA